MSGRGIELSSTLIRACYESGKKLYNLHIGWPDANTKEIFPIFYYNGRSVDNRNPFEVIEDNPECIVSNIIQALELLDDGNPNERAKSLEWTSPVVFKDNDIYYQIKDELLCATTNILRPIFNIIQEQYQRINRECKAVIAVPCTFGPHACDIIRKAASSLLGEVKVIKHDQAVAYANQRAGKTLYIECNEYVNNICVVHKEEVEWSQNFEDYNLPRHIFDYFISENSPDKFTRSERGVLYAFSRQCALQFMTGAANSYVLPMRKELDLKRISTEKAKEFVEAKTKAFMKQFTALVSKVDLDEIQCVVLGGEYSKAFNNCLNSFFTGKLTLNSTLRREERVANVFILSDSDVLQGTIKECATLPSVVFQTVISQPTNELRCSHTYSVHACNALIPVIPKGTKLPVELNDKPFCFAFDSKEMYVYFWRDDQYLTKYMLLRTKDHHEVRNTDIVIMYPMLDKDEKLSVAFYWRDTKTMIYYVDFSNNFGTPTFELPAYPTIHKLQCYICLNKQIYTPLFMLSSW